VLSPFLGGCDVPVACRDEMLGEQGFFLLLIKIKSNPQSSNAAAWVKAYKRCLASNFNLVMEKVVRYATHFNRPLWWMWYYWDEEFLDLGFRIINNLGILREWEIIRSTCFRQMKGCLGQIGGKWQVSLAIILFMKLYELLAIQTP
jgi:hypothetical protein